MNILVGVDFSDSARKVIAQAALLTRAPGAKIRLLHVAEPDPEFVGYKGDPTVMRDDMGEKYPPKHRQLQTTSQTLRDDGLNCVARLVQGATVETILRQAANLAADRFVVGSHRESALKRLLIGSTSEGILHPCKIPLHLVPTR